MKQNEIVSEIESRLKYDGRIFAAIDGRCASGKSTLAAAIARRFDAPVIHADDFFLPPYMRSAERLNTPGGNLDRERLMREVLVPLRNGKTAQFRPFECKNSAFGAEKSVFPGMVTLIEGSYCCHEEMWDFYDLHIFSDISKEIQRERIIMRDPERAQMFFSKWIPLEEAYFSAFDLRRRCEIIYEGEDF